MPRYEDQDLPGIITPAKTEPTRPFEAQTEEKPKTNKKMEAVEEETGARDDCAQCDICGPLGCPRHRR